MNVHMYVCMYGLCNTYVRMYVCMCICMYNACMYMYVCNMYMYVCMYVVCICIYICIMYVIVYACNMSMYECMYTYVIYIYMCIYIYIYLHIHVCMYVFINSWYIFKIVWPFCLVFATARVERRVLISSLSTGGRTLCRWQCVACELRVERGCSAVQAASCAVWLQERPCNMCVRRTARYDLPTPQFRSEVQRIGLFGSENWPSRRFQRGTSRNPCTESEVSSSPCS